MELKVRSRGWKLTQFCHANRVWRRRSEPERKAVARIANGSIGTAVSRGAMAACARVKCAEERAQMAHECPGATASPARPSESGADETADANLLASASRRALSARRQMTVVGETKACTRATTWSLRRESSCSRKDRRDRAEARK
eukprot:6193405-Pleurochrysis_carterae.AAC.2